MKVDYTELGFEFVSQILDINSLRLSRTREGRSDVSTSSRKRPLLYSGEMLRRISRQNEVSVYRFLYDTRHDPLPSTRLETEKLLLRIADITNDGLLPEGRLRTWSISPQHVPPKHLQQALDEFCDRLPERASKYLLDPIPVAAWAEWQLNGGSLHPFYDGCGRISRSFAACLLIRTQYLLPLYDDRTEYFAHGNRGIDAFIAYVRARIRACELQLP